MSQSDARVVAVARVAEDERDGEAISARPR
jgi:hypothetical protein